MHAMMRKRSHIQRRCKDAAFAARLSREAGSGHSIKSENSASKSGSRDNDSMIGRKRRKIKSSSNISDNRNWDCEICTLRNPVRKRKCGACGTPKPRKHILSSPSTNSLSKNSSKDNVDDRKNHIEGTILKIRVLSRRGRRIRRAEIISPKNCQTKDSKQSLTKNYDLLADDDLVFPTARKEEHQRIFSPNKSQLKSKSTKNNHVYITNEFSPKSHFENINKFKPCITDLKKILPCSDNGEKEIKFPTASPKEHQYFLASSSSSRVLNEKNDAKKYSQKTSKDISNCMNIDNSSIKPVILFPGGSSENFIECRRKTELTTRSKEKHNIIRHRYKTSKTIATGISDPNHKKITETSKDLSQNKLNISISETSNIHKNLKSSLSIKSVQKNLDYEVSIVTNSCDENVTKTLKSPKKSPQHIDPNGALNEDSKSGTARETNVDLISSSPEVSSNFSNPLKNCILKTVNKSGSFQLSPMKHLASDQVDKSNDSNVIKTIEHTEQPALRDVSKHDEYERKEELPLSSRRTNTNTKTISSKLSYQYDVNSPNPKDNCALTPSSEQPIYSQSSLFSQHSNIQFAMTQSALSIGFEYEKETLDHNIVSLNQLPTLQSQSKHYEETHKSEKIYVGLKSPRKLVEKEKKWGKGSSNIIINMGGSNQSSNERICVPRNEKECICNESSKRNTLVKHDDQRIEFKSNVNLTKSSLLPTLRKSKDKLQTTTSVYIRKQQLRMKSCRAMFQTAGTNKPIHVSEEGMENASRILSFSKTEATASDSPSMDKGSTNDASKPSNLSSGSYSRAMFQTAGTNKPIHVSEEGMENASRILFSNNSLKYCEGLESVSVSNKGFEISSASSFISQRNGVEDMSMENVKKLLFTNESHPGSRKYSHSKIEGTVNLTSEKCRFQNDDRNEQKCFSFDIDDPNKTLKRKKVTPSTTSLNMATPIQSSKLMKRGLVTGSLNVKNPYIIQRKAHSNDLNSTSNPITPIPCRLTHISGTFRGNPISPSNLAKAEILLHSNRTKIDHASSGVRIKKTRLHYDFDVEKERNLAIQHTKRGKKISLSSFNYLYGPLQERQDHNIESNLNPIVSNISFLNAELVRFDCRTFKPSFFYDCLVTKHKEENSVGGVNDIRTSLICMGCDKVLLLDCWIKNHFKWIVWKLASMENSFPLALGGRYLTYKHVISQLLARYTKEIKDAKRSALRKILNRDAAASDPLILCVCQISKKTLNKGTLNPDTLELELTDGWYSIKAKLDICLTSFVRNNKIKVGSKLMCIAEYEGPEEGIDPLDDDYFKHLERSSIFMTLNANSTRLAKWDSKLGFVRPSFSKDVDNFTLRSFNDVIPGGGCIPMTEVIVCRRYERSYYHKFRPCSTEGDSPGGISIFTEAEEDCARKEYESRRTKLMEKALESAEKKARNVCTI